METSGTTDLRETFKQFASAAGSKGLAVVISDFLDPQGFETAEDPGVDGARRLRRSHRLHVGQESGRARGSAVRRPRDGRAPRCGSDPALARAYNDVWEQHAAELELFCGRYNLGYVRADAERAFEQIILHTFRKGRFLA